MNDVVIIKEDGGLGRRLESNDAISGFIVNGVAVAAGVQLETVYRVKSMSDVVGLGITEQYDIDNGILVYEHLNEAFRVNPNLDLYVMLVDRSIGFSHLLDKSKPYAKRLLREANGAIKQLAVAFNPTLLPTNENHFGGMVAKAQELATEEFTKHRPVQILLEGLGFGLGTPPGLRTLNAQNVSLVIGQSASIVNREFQTVDGTMEKRHERYGAVGTVLGAVSKAAVNECVGWVQKFNMTGGSLLVPFFMGKNIAQISEGDIETFNEAGYIFFVNHTGTAGAYINDSHTCTAITSDYAYIENNRTVDKAARGIRQQLLPRLNSPILIDIETGQIAPQTIKQFELEAEKVLQDMQRSNEISGYDIFIDPNQDVLATSEVVIEFEVVPTGTARKIKGYIRMASVITNS